MFGEEDIIRMHKPRANMIGNVVLLCFGIVLARLWYLQVYKGNLLLNYSLQNRLRKEIVRAPRGMIFSRNNHLIVDNIPRFDAVLTPQYLKDKAQTLERLSKILTMEVEQIERVIKKNSGQASYRPIIVKKNISQKEVAIIETESSKVPGVSVETFISREYIDGYVGAHLLGYISEITQDQLPKFSSRDKYPYRLGDFIGQSGLEKALDLKLRGENGFEFMEVDALGRKKRHVNTDKLFQGIKNKPSKPGENVRLTIDRDLQKAAFDALEGKNGSVVAININTGELMAMVSRPSFNPSFFSRGLSNDYWSSLVNNEFNPLRDRTIQEHYAPGSTFKALTLLAALEEGIIDKNTTFKCTGRFRFGRRPYHCWKRWGHGEVDVHKALRESCDVFFYKIATTLDIDVLANYAKMFGLGVKTGVILPREVTGLVPSKAWKVKRNGVEWQKGETLSCVIGQSYMLTTPIQLALAYAGLANGKLLYKPMLIKEIFTNSGEIKLKNEPKVLKEIKISEESLKIVREGLDQVVNHPKGTVWWRRGMGLSMAGKTGTSQVIRMSAEKLFEKCEEKELQYRHHAIFVGYAPKDNPEIAVSAVVEHGCSGSRAAAPIVASVVEAYMKKYQQRLYEKEVEKDKKIWAAFWQKRKKEKEEKEEKEKLLKDPEEIKEESQDDVETDRVKIGEELSEAS